MKRLIPTAALFVATATPAQTAPPTPSTVLSHIVSTSARQTVLESYDTPQWNAILKGIASGDDDWLRVYEALRRVADAAACEDLGDAIHDALPQRPFEVLSLLGAESGATPQQLCTFTFESRRPAEGVGAYLGRLGQALDRASSTTQREVASACRLGIEATRKAFPER
ncbi:hypothetical protein ACQF4K_24045 [Ralstonia pseudosolanacearum]|uniref:hypothetical protein n=1 Tax=Ralstonia pseudosolanacearum TaxID=1310165 RepID=UPI00267646D2|nr:hypothetical protein [Ralstonia pseudosolanacearum]MDO3607933.1 hypothetical protein [Ralstonia pseudosolanacearum]MDO3613140.1 hypothetical protein [Ralstonia pseudosolanacearum]